MLLQLINKRRMRKKMSERDGLIVQVNDGHYENSNSNNETDNNNNGITSGSLSLQHQNNTYWLERPFICDDDTPHNIEATGQAMDAAAKGTLHSSNGFLGPALIQLASATCVVQSSTSSTCKVHGLIQPSSILTISNVISTGLAAIILPISGAILDRSRHRKTVGAVTAYLVAILNLFELFLSKSNWQFYWIIHTFSEFLYSIHNLIILAYLQNLTSNPITLAQYTSKFAIIQFTFMASYMFIMILYARISNADIVVTSSIAHMVSGTVGLILLGYAWLFLFRPRPPVVRQSSDSLLIDDGGTLTVINSNNTTTSILYNSISDIVIMIQRIRQHYPALKMLLLTLIFSPNVGSGSYFSIFSTIQKSLLQMDSTQIGLCNLLALLSTVIGAKLSATLCTRCNPLISFQLCILTFMTSTCLVAIIIKGPEQIPIYYGLSSIQGMSLGWLLPTERVLYCTLSPPNHEAEIMGLILCVHGSCSWLPPLLFSIVNEAGYNLRWALASENVLLAIALFLSLQIGDYNKAVEQVRNSQGVNSE